MDLIQIVALALLQGLTEFLPISSSAHLILLPLLADWQDQGLAFDIAVHVGTLAAVVLYFRQDIRAIVTDWTKSIHQRKTIGDSRLAWAVAIGTIPVGIVGLSFGDFIEAYLRNPIVIAMTTLLFGVLLGWADWHSKKFKNEHALTWGNILFIGAAQAIALIPGTSRSGITITAGLMIGLTREAAARFSFLLSIPVIFLAGGLKVLELVESNSIVDWTALFSGALFSFLSAYACIYLFLKMLDKIGMWPFVIYRLFLGVLLLWLFV